MIDHPAVAGDVSLAQMTTYKVGGSAQFMAEPATLSELREILEQVPHEMDVTVLGRGSNVVIADSGIQGLVIRLGHGFNDVAFNDDGSMVAGAGVALPKLARLAAREARAGLGFYVGIPGSVGGAVRMNAGGHGSDTGEVLIYAVVLDSSSAEVRRWPVDELGLAYRRSNLESNHIVVQASFSTTHGQTSDLEAELREITRWRKQHQPGGTLNAGSVFKNPEGQHAGAIIERAGLKGERFGPVRVSEIHANFLVAADDATANDIFRFVQYIRSSVAERCGVELEPEIKFLGSFPDTEVLK
ncbi:MAG: UDP-N-acetylmuramate dehydrogenase [Acidimicrobiia bacterium]|nr:MAG: UDP-N-acetylmuramate dehydrogenase [Acidimicrobiia bacterium]